MRNSDDDGAANTSVVTLATSVWERKGFVAVCAAFGFVATTLFAIALPPDYTVRIEIVPPTEGNITSLLSQVGSLAGAASLAGIRLPGGENPNFTFVVQILDSPSVLAEVDRRYGVLRRFYPRRWDDARKTWTPPSDNPVAAAIAGVRGVFQLPPHPYPTVGDLALLLKSNLETSQIEFTNVYQVSLRYEDPELAAQFLTWDVNTADSLIRADALKRNKDEIDYIDRRLQTVTVAEHRQALGDLLGNLERQNMLLSGGDTYAVAILEPPTIVQKPTLTGTVLEIVGGLAGGAILAIAAILLAPFQTERANRAIKRLFAIRRRSKAALVS